MNLFNLYLFIAWLLFGAYCALLARYTSTKKLIGLIISFTLHILTYADVVVLFFILMRFFRW